MQPNLLYEKMLWRIVMRAVIIRHGKVDFQWKKWSTSEQFNKDCKMYDEAPIFSLSSDVPQINYQDLYQQFT